MTFSKKKNWSKKRSSKSAQFLILLTIWLLLSACGGQEPVNSNGVAYYLPPTLSNTAQPIALVTATPVPATPTPECVESLEYIDDVTVPDGSAFAPGARIEKVWRVLNAGSCDWGAGYRLRFSGGELLGAVDEQALFPARGGSEAEITVIFEAPQQPGRYNSAWVAINPLGEEFGDVIFMDIIVDDTLQPTSIPEEGDTGE